jgi:hypothetical protein
VGDDDLFDLKKMLFDEVENVFDVVAGVDHHPFAGGLVPNNRAVALQWPDRKDFVDHGESLSASSSQFLLKVDG